MPKAEFEEMVTGFKDELKLDPIAQPRAPRNWYERFFDQSTVAGKVAGWCLLAVVGITTWVANDIKDILFPDYQMTLVAPPKQGVVDGQSIARVAAGCVVVAWEIRQDSLRPSQSTDAQGSIEIVDRAARFTVSVANHPSGQAVHLTEGDYVIYVRDDAVSARTADLALNVVATDGYDPAAATATCGPSPVP